MDDEDEDHEDEDHEDEDHEDNIDPHDIGRFHQAQEAMYARALSEIRSGRKSSHWIWYIFPQCNGMGMSYTSEKYSIKSIAEAEAYFGDAVLRERLIEITRAILEAPEGTTLIQIFGHTDALKVRSCCTLFDEIGDDCVFGDILERFCQSQVCLRTALFLESRLHDWEMIGESYNESFWHQFTTASSLFLFLAMGRQGRRTKVLDVGAGTGALSVLCGADSDNRLTIAVDRSASMLARIPTFPQLITRQLDVGTAMAAEFGESGFSHIASSVVLNFVPDAKQCINQLLSLLADDGVFILSSWAARKDCPALDALEALLKRPVSPLNFTFSDLKYVEQLINEAGGVVVRASAERIHRNAASLDSIRQGLALAAGMSSANSVDSAALSQATEMALESGKDYMTINVVLAKRNMKK